MKRVLSLVMALCMLLTCTIPVTAMATEITEAAESPMVTEIPENTEVPETTESPEMPKASGSATIPFQVNPIYEDVYTTEDFPEFQNQQPAEDAPTQESGIGQKPGMLYSPTFLTMEEATVLLRGYMKERRTSFDLYVVDDGIYGYEGLVDELLEAVMVHTGNPTEGDYLLWHYAGWGGTVEWDDGYKYGYTDTVYHFEVQMAYLTTAAQEQEMNTAVNRILDFLGVRTLTDYAKVKGVYDYICQNITYDYANLEDTTYLLKHSAYAALVNKTAVCQGYATLLYRLMLELGIDCRVIAGELATGGAHGWNIVKLGNVYYNLDATIDAGTDPYVCFLRNSVLNVTHYRYLEYMTLQFHTDYPMSETDYVYGVEGVPEYIFVSGVCGDDAYWYLDRDKKLTIAGTGATYDYFDGAPWLEWKKGIKELIVEEGITALGNYLFAQEGEQYQLSKVVLPDTLESIGDYTFSNNNSLTEIHIPDGVKSIGSGAFYGCYILRTVTLGKSLETIGSRAFQLCMALAEIQFPEGLKSIGSQAFNRCNALTEITIPASVTSVDGFSECMGLKNAYIYANCIDGYGFFNCANLENVVLGDTVTFIGPAAFENCDALKEITIPASVEIAKGFSECDNLETAYIYSREIDAYSFDRCTKLKNLVLSEDLTSIDICAFEYCQSLTEFTIPRNVTEVGGHAFRGCSALSVVYFTGDYPSMDDDIFWDVTATVYYPMNNDTWTEDVLLNYGGTLTWVPYCADHDYQAVTVPANCIQDGYTTYTCSCCQDTYIGDYVYATGQHTYIDDTDTDCDICGNVRDLAMPTTPMYRLYNPNSGEHFYTGSLEERGVLIAAGWQYESIAWNAPTSSGKPVYRLFNPNNGDHHYTMSAEERDMLVDVGWQYEGVCWNSADADNAEALPLYRLYNPNADCGSHHYTGSVEERDFLVNAGWLYEGIGWFGMLK